MPLFFRLLNTFLDSHHITTVIAVHGIRTLTENKAGRVFRSILGMVQRLGGRSINFLGKGGALNKQRQKEILVNSSNEIKLVITE